MIRHKFRIFDKVKLFGDILNIVKSKKHNYKDDDDAFNGNDDDGDGDDDDDDVTAIMRRASDNPVEYLSLKTLRKAHSS